MTKHIPKPEWLKVRLGSNEMYSNTSHLLHKNCMHTICESGRCPNQGECWSKGTATFMICGDICTRACRFCNTRTGKPMLPDPGEPQRLAESIRTLGIKYAVVTSVDRDDLADYGVSHWRECLSKIKELNPDVKIEALIPDFNGIDSLIDMVIDERPHVIAHNIETVRRLTPDVRSVASYERSLDVIRHISQSGVISKSGFMLGLGETNDEVSELLDDLLESGCSSVTIGQYLQPTRRHLPVSRYVSPEEFEEYKILAHTKGFKKVVSGVLVRSSYHADE